MHLFHATRQFLIVCLVVGLVIGLAVLPRGAVAQDAEDGAAVDQHDHSGAFLTIGVVPQFEPRKLAGIWLPILQNLEQRLGMHIHLEGSKDIPEFEAKLAQGVFDLAYMNPYHLLVANRQQGYVPLVRDGGRSLYGILVVSKTSPIKDVTELDGAEIAFPSPNALGASLLMRAELDRSVGISITPKYVQTHSSVYLNVALGQTAAGGGVMGTFNQQPDEVKNALRVLYVTRDMPTHPLAAHPRVAEDVRQNITQAFLDLATSEQGQALLDKVPFKKVIATTYGDYAFMAEMGLEDYYVTSQ